jgi:predicted nucleotidyltransferase
MVESDGLPAAIQTGLNSFTEALRQVFADDLSSIVLFGSAADGRLRPTSDVNLIIVLQHLDPVRLGAIGAAYRLAHAAIRLSAMFLLESEIAVASDAFAVKFFDVAHRRKILHGRDPFADLALDRAALIRRLRQVLVNLTLRLREHYALSGPFPERLAFAAADAVGPLRASAALLLSLEGGGVLAPREALAEIARKGGELAALAAINAARETGFIPEGGGDAALFGAIRLAALIEAEAERLT